MNRKQLSVIGVSLYSDTSNNLLIGEVEIVSSPKNATVICTFLCEFTGCEVQYGTDPTYMNLPFSAESNETSTAGNTVIVVLKEQLNSSTVYYFTVSAVVGDVTMRVLGNFTTPQYSMYIHNVYEYTMDYASRLFLLT